MPNFFLRHAGKNFWHKWLCATCHNYLSRSVASTICIYIEQLSFATEITTYAID